MTQIFRKRGIVHFHPRKAELMEIVEVIWEVATETFEGFNLKLSDVPVVLTNANRAAGSLRSQENKGMDNLRFNLEFNTKVMDMDWEEMEDTIPHEIAHLVDKVVHGKSSNHGPRWQRIAKRLGSTAKRTHSVKIAASRRQRRFCYVATCGTEIELTTVMHNKVQRGSVRVLRSTRGRINAQCYIGEAGKANAYVNIGSRG